METDPEDAAMPDSPNILLIMTDQQKATASHLYGNAFCETPSLARLADGGVRYEYAFTPHPLCVPARVSLWSSQYPHAHGARRNETLMPAGAEHAFRMWSRSGYELGLIGKNHCFREPGDLGLFDVWCELSHGGRPRKPETRGMGWWRPTERIDEAHELRRAMPPQNATFSYAVSDAPLEDQSTGLIAGQAVRYLEQHKDRPFALWVSFPDPHEPWVVPRQYADMFPPHLVECPPRREGEFGDLRLPERNRVLYRMLGMGEAREEDVYGLLGAYYGMVRFIDDAVGQILDALDRLELRENTIVVFCSDHGDFMGEHNMQCKGGVFYDCLTRVPLIVSWPGTVPEGIIDRSLVNLVDVVPTLLDLQGIEIPRCMQGERLPSATNASPRDAAFSEYGAGGAAFTFADLESMPKPHGRQTLLKSLRWREAAGRRKMVRTHEWKYVHDPMGDLDELYDLVSDPWEQVNVADVPENAPVISDMRRRLADWSIMTEDAAPVPLPPTGRAVTGSGRE